MKNIISLIKLELEDSYNKSNKKNYALKTIIILIALIGIAISVFINFSIYQIVKLMPEYLYIYPLILIIATFLLTFFSLIYRTKNTIFSLKDNVNLTPLPIKKKDIIIAKITLAYLEELIFSLLIFIPSFFLYTQTDISYIFYGLILTLTIPMLSLLCAFIIGFLLQLLVTRIPFLKYFGTVLYMAFVIGCCLISLWTNTIALNLNDSNLNDSNLNAMLEVFPFNVLYNAFIAHNVFCLLGYIALTIVSFVLVVVLYTVFYDKFFNLLNYVAKKRKFTKDNIKTNKYFVTIIKNDLKRLVNEQMFFMSAIIPGILAGLLTVIFYFIFKYQTDVNTTDPSTIEALDNMLSSIIIFIPLFFLSMASYTAFAITFEGKNFWIIKTLPISNKTYFWAKLVEQQILEGSLMLVSSIIIIIFAKFNILASISVIVLPQLFIFFTGCLGLFLNLLFPKLTWSNFKQIKNSVPNLIMGFGGMAIGISICIAGILLSSTVGLWAGFLAALIAIIVLIFVSFILLFKAGKSLYLRIEV